MRIKAAALVLATAAALGLGSAARAGDECDGLDVCIALAGPWVVVPSATVTTGGPTYYELRCPRRNMVVAGLDADLGERGVGLEFLGSLGSPVGPGIATSNAVVFVATHTGADRRPATFRPRIGCVPTTGGGGRETTAASVPSAQQAAKPPVRRVRTARLGAAPSQTLRHGCRPGERLVSSSATIAFRRAAAPDDSLLQKVHLTRRVAGGAVVVLVKIDKPLPRGTGMEVQIHAVCARR
jgi:hypothetical protein